MTVSVFKHEEVLFLEPSRNFPLRQESPNKLSAGAVSNQNAKQNGSYCPFFLE